MWTKRLNAVIARKLMIVFQKFSDVDCVRKCHSWMGAQLFDI
jgi:hypothetical protein